MFQLLQNPSGITLCTKNACGQLLRFDDHFRPRTLRLLPRYGVERAKVETVFVGPNSRVGRQPFLRFLVRNLWNTTKVVGLLASHFEIKVRIDSKDRRL